MRRFARSIIPFALVLASSSALAAVEGDEVRVGVDTTATRFAEDNGYTMPYGNRIWLQWLPFAGRMGFELQFNTPTTAPLSWDDGGGSSKTYDVNLRNQAALLFVASNKGEVIDFQGMIGLSVGEVAYSNPYTTLANGTRVYHNVAADTVRHDGGLEIGARVGYPLGEHLNLTGVGMLRMGGHNPGTSSLGIGLNYGF